MQKFFAAAVMLLAAGSTIAAAQDSNGRESQPYMVPAASRRLSDAAVPVETGQSTSEAKAHTSCRFNAGLEGMLHQKPTSWRATSGGTSVAGFDLVVKLGQAGGFLGRCPEAGILIVLGETVNLFLQLGIGNGGGELFRSLRR
jgi:hypothetical protein